jgi:hypothetical protein
MTMKLTRAQKKAKLEAAAAVLIEQLLDWDEANGRPNLTAIEDEVLKLRQQFGQEMAAALVYTHNDGLCIHLTNICAIL